MDANGILNVQAAEKSSGKSEKITITNDKGRLSKDDIERMVEEAERFKEADGLLKEKLEAKQKMESQIFQSKSMITDKLPAEIKESANNFLSEKETWLNNNPNAEKSEYEEQIAEITAKMMEMTKSNEEPGAQRAEKEEEEEPGPQIEEID
jgi:molecular chaperone DnaK (HSP70)